MKRGQRARPRLSGAAQVLIGMFLGIASGLFFGEIVAPLELVGDAFIKLLQITVIPYIVVALVVGLGRLSYEEIKVLAVRGGGVLLCLWALAILVIVIMPLAFPDWPSRSFFQKSSIAPESPPDFLNLYIPANPFFALSNAVIPAVVVFSVLVGLALVNVKEKAVLIEPLSAVADILMGITGLVAKLAPFGVFALMAHFSGTTSFVDLARLQVWIVIHVLVVLFLGLGLLPALITCVAPVRYRDILRMLRTPLITAFATGSALVVLPLLAENCKQLIAEAYERTGMAEDEEETGSSVDVLVPTFFSFPTVGGVLNLGFVLFAGWYIGSSIPLSEYPGLVVAGLASLFGGAVLTIPFVLELVELPRDLFDVFLSTNVITGRFVTMLSAMHYAAIALVGTFALKGAVRLNAVPLLRTIVIGGALIGAMLGGVHAFYTHVVVVPYTKDDALKGLSLLRRPQPAVVHREPQPMPAAGSPRPYAEIIDSGVLRACYLSGNYPLSYFNAGQDLVGFDIEMAHRLAERLSLSVEFLPLRRLKDGQKALGSGHCDVLFNSVAMELRGLETTAETRPFNTTTVAFVVLDHQREDFATWAQIQELGDIEIAASAFQTLPPDIWSRLPESTLERFSSLAEQTEYFESGGEGADVFLDSAEEGAAWTILYPRFSVVVPRPILQFPVVYTVAKDNTTLLRALNAWLLIAKETGHIDDLYDYWIQGRIEAVQPPRWSVLRNVLGWVD